MKARYIEAQTTALDIQEYALLTSSELGHQFLQAVQHPVGIGAFQDSKHVCHQPGHPGDRDGRRWSLLRGPVAGHSRVWPHLVPSPTTPDHSQGIIEVAQDPGLFAWGDLREAGVVDTADKPLEPTEGARRRQWFVGEVACRGTLHEGGHVWVPCCPTFIRVLSEPLARRPTLSGSPRIRVSLASPPHPTPLQHAP